MRRLTAIVSLVLEDGNAMYIHKREHWPHFLWNWERLSDLLIELRYRQGCLLGGMKLIGFQLREEVVLQTLTQDVVKSSEIEGEILDRSLVRSSVARRLGMDVAANAVDRNVEGVVEMMLDATQRFDQPLTQERLLAWHTLLFPTGRSGFTKVRVGAWRSGPVHVISGYRDKETVHFEGPAASRVPREMALFLDWFNRENTTDPILKAALAHLWFLTIHPFEDGNGRIGRAIADLLLARSEQSSQRFYSLSSQIQLERKDYYTILEQTQKGTLDITPWMTWFFECLGRAIENALTTLDMVARKAQFWDSLAEVPLNERQHKIIGRMLDGLEGKLTSSKWAKMAKCSQDTAYRDILDLLHRGIFVKNAEGGRSTSYSLASKE